MLRNVRLLYLHNFLNDFRFQEAFLVIHFAALTGSYTAAMSVLALATFSSALLDIPTGMYSDKVGRKFTLLVGSVSMTLGITCYAFASGLPLLCVGAVLCGLSQCLFNGNNNALLYETLKAEGLERRFHHYQGRAGSMYQLALGLSALSASFLTGNGLKLVFMLGIIPQALSIFVALLFKEPRTHIARKPTRIKHLRLAVRKIARNPKLWPLVLGQAISFGTNEVMFKFVNAFVDGLWSLWGVALYRTAGHALAFMGFWFSGHVLDRFAGAPLMIFAETCRTVAKGLAALLSNFYAPFFLLFGSVFFGPFMVARDHLLQTQFSQAQRATMGSIASFVGSICFGVIALAVGVTADHFGLAAGLGFGVLTGATAIPLFIKAARS